METSLIIYLKSLRFHAFHGCIPQERKIGNDYQINISLKVRQALSAIERDELSGTVDYAEVYSVIQKEMKIPSSLLEHVGGRICRAILEAFPKVEKVNLELSKLAPPIQGDCQEAGVFIKMKR